MRNISSYELSEWKIYSELEPFGEQRMDFRFAMVMALLAEINRNPKKRKKPYTIKDFMPDFSGDFEKRTMVDENIPQTSNWQILLGKVIAANKKLGGEDKRRK